MRQIFITADVRYIGISGGNEFSLKSICLNVGDVCSGVRKKYIDANKNNDVVIKYGPLGNEFLKL